jgi:hypothetical protein
MTVDYRRSAEIAFSVLRAYVATQALGIWLIGYAVPTSMMSEAMREADPMGAAVMAILLAAGTIAFLDCAINDWMPRRFTWPWAWRWRYMISLLLALAYVLTLLVMVHSVAEHPSFIYALPFYGLEMVFCIIVTFLGMRFRYRIALSGARLGPG